MWIVSSGKSAPAMIFPLPRTVPRRPPRPPVTVIATSSPESASTLIVRGLPASAHEAEVGGPVHGCSRMSAQAFGEGTSTGTARSTASAG